MKKSILVLIICASVLSLLAFGVCSAKEKVTWRMGTTKEGGFAYGIGVGIAKVISDFAKTTYIEALPSPGYSANVRLMQDGQLELGLAQTFVLDSAYKNKPPFDKKPLVWPPYQLMSLYTGEMFVLTSADSEIKTWDDLAGKKVYPTPRGTGCFIQARSLLEATGLWDKIKEAQMSFTEAADALKIGKIDALFVYSNCGARALAGWIREVDARCKIKLVTPSQKQMDQCHAIPGLYGAYMKIPPFSQDIGAKDKMWASFGPSMLACAPSLETDRVYEITKVIFEHSDDLIKAEPGLTQFDQEKISINEGAIGCIDFVPVHPGAAKYYREIGIWKDNWIEGKVTQRPK
jgi:TRAP transporter TAXI family solute receptor